MSHQVSSARAMPRLIYLAYCSDRPHPLLYLMNCRQMMKKVMREQIRLSLALLAAPLLRKCWGGRGVLPNKGWRIMDIPHIERAHYNPR